MITLKVVDFELEVRFKYFKELVDLCKDFDGRWDSESKNWYIPYNRASDFISMLSRLYYFDYDNSVLPLFIEEPPNNFNTDPIMYEYELPKINGQLWMHQVEAFRFIYHNLGGIVALPPGTGKTIVPILFSKINSNMLYICPASAKVQVAREFKKFTGKDVTVIHAKKNRNYNVNGVIIVNYELFRRDYNIIPMKDIVVLDEAHYVKSPKLKRGKNRTRSGAVLEYIKRTQAKVIALTGTPIIRNLEDTVMLMHILGKFTNYWAWKKSYGITDQFGNIIALRASVRNYIKTLRNYTYYRDKRDILDIPETQIIHTYVHPYPDEKKYYNDLRNGQLIQTTDDDDNFTQLNGYFIKQREAAISPMLIENKKYKSAKKEWLENFLDDFDNKYLLIYSSFLKGLDLAESAIDKNKYTTYRIDGSVKEEIRQTLIDNWKKTGGVMLISDAAAMSLNLQFCHEIVLLNLPITYEKFSQLIGRIERGGQLNRMQIYILYNEDTVDEAVWKILEFEKLHSETILNSQHKLMSVIKGEYNEIQ